MDKMKRVEEEIEKTMDLLDNVGKLEPNPYLFTRIKTRLDERGEKNTQLKEEGSFAVKLLPALMVLLVVFNFFSIIDFVSSDKTEVSVDNRTEYIQQLGDEFMLNQSSYYPITLE